jgi:hypothetical protein
MSLQNMPPPRSTLLEVIAWVGAMLLLPLQASAYELTTHALLTYKAYVSSSLQPGSQLYRSLGIDVLLAPLDPTHRRTPFGETYYDFTGTDARPRIANGPGVDGKPFDSSRMPKISRPDGSLEFSPDTDNLRLPGWFMRGAIREDDDAKDSEPNPKDDPFDPLKLRHRVLGHFYDPINMKGLNLGGVEYGLAAPAWAIGVAPSNIFSTSLVEDTGRSNHFTVYDAREAMYRALTGRNRDQVAVAYGETERKKYWATSFRVLGDVVHLVQDMAQPQHTRNEPHAGLGPSYQQPFIGGHKSVFEAYIEARARGAGAFQYAVTTDNKVTITVIPGRSFPTGEYPIPRFNRYSDYFSTAPRDGIAQGAGLADYSNRGFFSAGRNFSDTTYSLPSRNVADYQIVALPPVAWNGTPINSVAPIYVYKGRVSDTVISALTASAVPLTSRSVWDQFLVTRQVHPYYSLNYINYDAAADLLLPRAVAYSAGLIDYFFRGQMEISLPDEGVYGVIDHAIENQAYASGFRKIKLKLRNITPPIVPTAGPNKGQSIAQDMTGSVLAVVKYHENVCYSTNLTGEFGSQEIRSAMGDREFDSPDPPPGGCRVIEEKITVSNPMQAVMLTANAANSTTLTFTFANPIPINATDVYLQVVFRGMQGSEQDAVVVATKDISEPTHITLVNVTDYLVCYNDTWYYKNADGTLPTSIPTQYSSALQAMPYTSAQFAFGSNATAVANGSLTKPLVLVTNLPPGQFARFAVLTESEVIYNDEIAGFYAPDPPPYKLHYPTRNQLTVHGNDLPNDPYTLSRDWGRIGIFRNTRYRGLFFGYPRAGTGNCFLNPAPAAPADPWKPFPPEPGYAYVPLIKPVTVNFN